MPPFSEVMSYLRALRLLAAEDARGLQAFDISDQAVLRSFYAFVWCLPPMIIHWAVRRLEYVKGHPEAHDYAVVFFGKMLVLEIATWMIPVVVLMLLSFAFQFRPLLRTLIVAHNWFAVPLAYVIYGIIAPITFFSAQGNGGHPLFGMIALLCAVLLIALVLSWRILITIMGGPRLVRVATMMMVIGTQTLLATEIEKLLGVSMGGYFA